MTIEQMLTEETKQKSSSKLYKVESRKMTDQNISTSVRMIAQQMTHFDKGEIIDLNNVEVLKAVTMNYLAACETVSTFPSMSGLARCAGCSRQALYDYMRKNPHRNSTKWLQMFHDACSDVLSEASLKGDCQPIVAIFLQKALYNLRENFSLEVVNTASDRYDEWTELSHDELIERAALLCGEDPEQYRRRETLPEN